MPGTASNQTTKKAGRAARLSARVRAQSATATTPVLFRLPTIDLLSIAKEREAAERAEEAIEQQQAELAINATDADPVAGRIFTTTLLTNSRGEVAAKQRAAEAVAAPDADAAPSPIRSWWEHWSSGIVLILLIIALVTASIIALNDSGSNQAELAKSNNSQTQDELQIPDLSDLNEEIVEATETIPAASALATATATDTAVAANTADEVPTDDESNDLIPPALQLASDGEQADTSTDLIGAVGDVASNPVDNNPADVGLLPPNEVPASTEKPAATEFDLAGIGSTMPLPGESTGSSTNVQNNTVQLGQPIAAEGSTSSPTIGFPQEPQPTLSASKNNDPAVGASPSLYDGAASSPLNTNQPSVPALLTGSSTLVPQGQTTETPSQPAQGSGQVAPGTSSPTQATIRQTSTPDFDTDSVIRKYQEFSKLPANRYAPSR